MGPNRGWIALVVAATLSPALAAGGDGEPPATRGAPSLAGASPPPAAGGLEEPTAEDDRGRWREGGFTLPVAETMGVTFVTMGWNRYVGAAPWANVSADSVGRNLRSRWVLDDNAFWVNQLGHPYQGTWSFTAARSSGLGFWESAPFPFFASAFWELAGETELPAVNDQVTTTIAGIVLGEIAHRFAGALRAEGGAWRVTLASLLSPIGALNERALGTSGAAAAPPSRWQLSLGTVEVEGRGIERGRWEPLGYAGFSFVYGLPGSAGLELERPFDHFVLEAGYGAAADPVATVRARGLLLGSDFDLDAVRGLFGLFLSFDLDTPPRHRISTSAVGFGGSARADLAGGLALEADAIASGILLGAGGDVDRGPEAGDRDYRFGPGEQALLGLRLLAGTRASAGIVARQYLLVGGGADAGTSELLLEGSATALVRIAGPHGVGVEVSHNVRRARADGVAQVRQADSVVRIYYALIGGTAGKRPRLGGAGLVAARGP